MALRASLRVRFIGAALLAAVVGGCGGGGGGSGEPAPAPQVPSPPAPPPVAQVLTWGLFPEARGVIGQTDFSSGTLPTEFPVPIDRLDLPEGSPTVAGSGTLFVSASGGVKAFDNYEVANGPDSRFTIASASRSVFVQGGKLVYVADHEVRIHDTIPTRGDAAATTVIGGAGECKPNRLNSPGAAYLTPGGRLVVADTRNNRVLIWHQIPRNGENADVVVGQEHMFVCHPNGGNLSASRETLNNPTSIWSDDTRLVVVDQNNNRVLIWDTFPTEPFQPATRILGQLDGSASLPNGDDGLTSRATLSGPKAVDVRPSGQMAVADTGNHRVLIWDAFPSAAVAQPADQVVGQQDFTGSNANAGGVVGASTLRSPSGVHFHGRNLVVTDSGNHRVLVFPAQTN